MASLWPIDCAASNTRSRLSYLNCLTVRDGGYALIPNIASCDPSTFWHGVRAHAVVFAQGKKMLKSLTYVSRSMLSSSRRDAELDAILAVARTRNAALGVTGALIASSYTFAQLLEGPAQAVDEVMESLSRDPRHRQVKIISVEAATVRRFPGWTMAFSGHANYIDRHIETLLDPSFNETDPVHVGQLQSLIEEFSKRLG